MFVRLWQPFLGVGATQEVKLYVIMSPVGPYFPEGFNPIKLYADTENIRAWPGGVGNTKVRPHRHWDMLCTMRSSSTFSSITWANMEAQAVALFSCV